MIHTHPLEYIHHKTTLEAHIAHPADVSGKLPVVLLMHAWEGRNEFVVEKANYYAGKGYVGVALDNYGKGILGHSLEENSKLMTPLMDDRKFLAERLIAGFEAIKQLPFVDSNKIVVMGFCFGGLCALDLLRNAVELVGVISVHGLLGAPKHYAPRYNTTTKVLALTGYNDPMVVPQQVSEFEHELDQAKVDWQMITYGQTSHAFTNPKVNDTKLGLIYNPLAAKRSTVAIDNFINECFI
jgi:dienelactone hydrolase